MRSKISRTGILLVLSIVALGTIGLASQSFAISPARALFVYLTRPAGTPVGCNNGADGNPYFAWIQGFDSTPSGRHKLCEVGSFGATAMATCPESTVTYDLATIKFAMLGSGLITTIGNPATIKPFVSSTVVTSNIPVNGATCPAGNTMSANGFGLNY